MGRKAVSEVTNWHIIGIKDFSMISNRELARRLKISENCVIKNLKKFITTGVTTSCRIRKVKRNHGTRKQSSNSSSKSHSKVKLL